jgi:hypothetical protein
VEDVEIPDLKLFAVERDLRAPAGHGQIVGANRFGPVAAKGWFDGDDLETRRQERSEDSDRASDHG